MKPGDRVRLSEALEDLIEGMEGTVVSVQNHIDHERDCFVAPGTPCLAVQFDDRSFPSVNRRVNGKWQLVISKCKKIES